MIWWIGIAVFVIVGVAVLVWLARRADSVEDDTSYLNEERDALPFGQAFRDILRENRKR